MPAAGLLTMMAAAQAEAAHADLCKLSAHLSRVVFKEATHLKGPVSLELKGQEVVVRAAERITVEAAAVTVGDQMPQLPGGFDLATLRDSCKHRIETESLASFYANLERQGVQMGPRFRVLQTVYCSDMSAVAELRLPAAAETWEHALQLPNWSLLDGAIQLLGFLGHDRAGVCVPFSVESCWLAEVPLNGRLPKLTAYANITFIEVGMIRGDVALQLRAER